ncbi:C40 family peptidase [Streptomyces roseolilacinus]|uniref:Glycoside hydrolase n=1 Tax=Streptomyces roseolilacinus TaxID=66904 RepID=A0A918EM26_9ACTN|nr:C40 family peptidase [Streptomyces roseolilacinus]GGQ26864.1 glycoside hydrolase [Streptomyces roseolilacinus]
MSATQNQVPVPHSRTAPHVPSGGASPDPSPTPPAPARISRIVSALTLAAVGGTLVAPGAAPPAHAAPAVANKALKVAASKQGAPYQWGAMGPYRFDCSGLTLYSYKRAGKKLPRTAQAQYNKTRQVAKSDRRKGDLVFFHGNGGVYHVGIYAGNNRIWHSPKTGSWVKLDRIWSKSVSYGRVR